MSQHYQGNGPTFVGRAREQVLLHDLLGASEKGSGKLVLLSGEAGIGKTTLVSNFIREARKRDWLVLTGGCYDLTTTPPYGPWLEVIDQYAAGSGMPLAPQVLRRGAEVGDISNQLELFETAYSFFATLSASQPLMLVLEDLHWSDPASLELLRYLARQLQQQPVLLVATYRADEVTAGHPLAPLLPLLVREAGAERLDLRQLGEADVRAVVDARYRMPPADAARLLNYLVTHTEGNPLYIREVLRTLEDDHILQFNEDTWALRVLDHNVVPPLIRQWIGGRVERLSEQTRDLLAVAAVIGQQAPIELWSQVTAVTDVALLPAIEEAIAANFIQATQDGTAVRFVHALVREAVYDGIFPVRRRQLHQQVAEHLAGLPLPNLDVVADHYQRAGDPRAIEWLIQAGDRAYRTYAWRTAIDRFDAAAQRLADDPERARERGWLLYRTGRMLRLSSPVDGVDRLQKAERVARAIGDDILAAYALADRGLGRCFAGDIRRGIDEMAAGVAALDALPEDHLRRDPGIATWIADALRTDASSVDGSAAPPNVRRTALALWLAIVGRHAEAIASGESCRQEVTDATRLTEVAAGSLGDAYDALGFAYAELGRPDAADAAFNQACEIYRSFDHHEMVWSTLASHLWLVICPYFATDLARRRSLVEEAEAVRSGGHGALGGSTLSPVSAASLAVDLLAGQWMETGEMIDIELGETSVMFRAFTRCAFGYIAWGQGGDDVAWQQIHATFADGPHTEPGDQPFGPALELQRLAINLALDHGNLDHARAWLEMQERWLAWSGAVRRQADAHLLWARFHLLDGDSAAARQDATRAFELASDPRQPLTLLASHRFLGTLDTRAGHYTEAEEHLRAALDLAAACEAPFERALTSLELARLRIAQKQPDDARGLLDDVRTICEPLKAQPTLDRVAALEAALQESTPAPVPFGLTLRELEVLTLVADGLTDPQVAERLFVSPRTVSSHLTSIYNKLGVSSRAAATRIAVEQGIL